MSSGQLILVVGPSGVGKDTLLEGAKTELACDNRFVFPKRLITRPACAGGEDHQAVSEADFQAMLEAGAFALHWHAHGLNYGIPSSILTDLKAGQTIVLNGSRATLPLLRERFANLAVIAVNIPTALLRERLLARGRETGQDIEQRLARAAAYDVTGHDVIHLTNDQSISVGIHRLVTILQSSCPTAVNKTA